MSLMHRLDEDLKSAMKQREAGKVRLSVIRMIKAAVKYAQVEKGRELTEDEVLSVIGKEMKLRRDTLPDFEKAERKELAEALRQELLILEDYLPQQLTEEEVAQLVTEAVLASGAQGPRDIGKVMAILMPKVKGRTDGKLVNRLVSSALASK